MRRNVNRSTNYYIPRDYVVTILWKTVTEEFNVHTEQNVNIQVGIVVINLIQGSKYLI